MWFEIITIFFMSVAPALVYPNLRHVQVSLGMQLFIHALYFYEHMTTYWYSQSNDGLANAFWYKNVHWNEKPIAKSSKILIQHPHVYYGMTIGVVKNTFHCLSN